MASVTSTQPQGNSFTFSALLSLIRTIWTQVIEALWLHVKNSNPQVIQIRMVSAGVYLERCYHPVIYTALYLEFR